MNENVIDRVNDQWKWNWLGEWWMKMKLTRWMKMEVTVWLMSENGINLENDKWKLNWLG